MKNNTNLAPIQEVYELKENIKLPSVEKIKKSGLSEKFKNALLDPNAKFENNLQVYCYVCSKSEDYVDLEVACFSCDSRHVSKWCHDNDGCRSSNTQISNKAYIRCKSCGIDRHMSNWVFQCSKHWGTYQSINRKAFNKAMGIALNMENCSQVVTDLAAYVGSHPEKFNNN